jgi:lipopolysaccharide transport system ATP-binding protein
MNQPIIEITGLGKKYRIGAHKEPYLSLRDELAKPFRRLFSHSTAHRPPSTDAPPTGSPSPVSPPTVHRPPSTDFWALKDVSFSVNQGEAVGIIGRNGAGKSTLLKILSQITPPTEGKITCRGRIASLLEVGTGFHPELTGRENIYMNGAILGMRRAEITRKFDEIVAFAEVEQFLDTPVKRYSSGMYVRLAFAVAAHLEPEILIVDEVLAVGDAEFQKKCLGKMQDVAKGGRTVLFVSHNMAAVEVLCSHGLLLRHGQVEDVGPIRKVVSTYMSGMRAVATMAISERTDHEGNKKARIVTLDVTAMRAGKTTKPSTGASLIFDLGYKVFHTIDNPVFYITIWNDKKVQIIHLNTRMAGFPVSSLRQPGTIRCEISKCPVPPGVYTVNVAIGSTDGFADRIESAMTLEVSEGAYFDSTDTTAYGWAQCLVEHAWSFGPKEE